MRFFKREVPTSVQPQVAQAKGVGWQRPAVFSHLSEHDLSQIYHAATTRHFQKDEFALREGEECSCLYIILSGRFRLVDRNNLYNCFLKEGDFFGETAFKEKMLNIYSSIALEHSVCMEIKCGIVSHFSEKSQLAIYKKLNYLSVDNIYRLSNDSNTVHKRNSELTSYIRRMRSQTDGFINSEAFQSIIKSIPKLPKCAGSLLSKLVDDSVSAKEVTESVQEEPSLAAEILKRVNSAYYGLQEKVSSLHHAILYLGFNNVYQLILENSVKNILPQDEEYEQIRLHSYMISLIASQISSDCQKSKPLINGTIGILHDVGKIITLLLKRRYPNIKEMINMLDESKIGSCLLRTWEFPENIIKIIEYQYDPEFSHPDNIVQEYKDEVSILYFAHVCYDLLIGEYTISTIFIDDYMDILGIKQKDYREFYQQKIFPALVKNKKRLPDKICSLLHEQAAAAGQPRLRVQSATRPSLTLS